MVIEMSKSLRLFVGSMLLVFISIFTMFLYNIYLPQIRTITYDDEFSKPFSPPKIGEIRSYEEVMASHREAERIGKIREARDDKIKRNTYEDWKEMKQYALPVVWIPWLILPLFLRLNRKKFLIIISAPIVMVFTGAVIWFEIPFYLIAMLIGVWLKMQLDGFKNRKPQ